MKDSRGEHAKDEDEEFPCIKVYTTFDAPIENVCDYLSNANHMGEYNDLVVAHRDLEDITPHGKICWSLCPKILFIKVNKRKKKLAVIIIIEDSYSHILLSLAKRFCYLLPSPLEARWCTDRC
jgi:hypothetical protein